MNTTIYKDAQDRMPTQRETLLKMLREAGENGILNTELVKVCIGYRSRIAELYQAGYTIDTSLVSKGVCRYTLISEPEVIRKPEKAMDLLVNFINEKHDGIIIVDDLQEIMAQCGLNVVRKHGSHKIA